MLRYIARRDKKKNSRYRYSGRNVASAKKKQRTNSGAERRDHEFLLCSSLSIDDQWSFSIDPPATPTCACLPASLPCGAAAYDEYQTAAVRLLANSHRPTPLYSTVEWVVSQCRRFQEGNGAPPPIRVLVPHYPPPNEIFGERNWTSGMKIH